MSETLEFDEATPPDLCRKLRRAVEHIEENLQRNPTLDEIATLVEMNPQYFARTFKKWVGQPPHKYIVAKKVERAKRLLRSTDLPLADIALRVGLASQSHFTTVFHRLTGMTPKAYREQ